MIDGSVRRPSYALSHGTNIRDQLPFPKESWQADVTSKFGSGPSGAPETDRNGVHSDHDLTDNVSVLWLGEEKHIGVIELTFGKSRSTDSVFGCDAAARKQSLITNHR